MPADPFDHCLKKTATAIHTLKKLSFVLSPVVILCCNIFIRVYHKAIYFLNNTQAFSFIFTEVLIFIFFPSDFYIAKIISPAAVYPLYVLQNNLPRSVPLSHHIHTGIL